MMCTIHVHYGYYKNEALSAPSGRTVRRALLISELLPRHTWCSTLRLFVSPLIVQENVPFGLGVQISPFLDCCKYVCLENVPLFHFRISLHAPTLSLAFSFFSSVELFQAPTPTFQTKDV